MIIFDGSGLSIDNIVNIAQKKTRFRLSDEPEFLDRISKGSRFLEKLLAEDGEIYGVTTGYGDSCTVSIPSDLVKELPQHLYTFHGCGMGKILSPEMTRATLAVRLASLCKGYSGVSIELLQQLALFLELDILPIIPEEGSVGASGDLTPLSYVAACLCGEREVFYSGDVRKTSEVLQELKIAPLTLRPKEGLAIMNGTAVMTGIACMAFSRAQYLAALSTKITAMCTIAINGNAHHFNETLFSVKPHPGQQQTAARLRKDLNAGTPPRNPKRLQDRYSIRCAPHVIGALEDSLPWLTQMIENEVNSANDNPIIDGENELVLHGGHFYGGHIALAMDTLKNTVANLADLLDRQLAMLMDTKFNNGLPANLSGANGDRAAINHGFKAVQIGASAWTAEALKNTMPASVFSRSTECHNQDKVSMGTIAARDCLRVLELTEQVASASLLATTQGIQLRLKEKQISATDVSSSILGLIESVRSFSSFLDEDRGLEKELRQTLAYIQQQRWTLYGEDANAHC